MGFFQQLLLLLWKNFTLRKRHKIRLVAEILFPLALFVILVLVRLTKPELKEKRTECHYDAKAMPSAGTLPFLQSYLCTFNNTCHETPLPDEGPNFSSFNTSLITKVIEDLELVLSDKIDVEFITLLIEDIDTLGKLYPLILNGTTQGSIRVGNTVVNVTRLREQIITQDLPISLTTLDYLLNATVNFTVFTNVFQPGLGVNPVIEIIEALLPEFQGNASLEYLTQELRKEFCDENWLTRLLIFPNNETAQNVSKELCSLNLTQAEELLIDFRNDINTSLLVDEVLNFISSNGNALNLNLTMIEKLVAVYDEIQNRSSLWDLVRELNATFSLLAQMQSQTINQDQVLQSAGTFLCGRGSTFVFPDEDSDDDLTQPPQNNDPPVDPDQQMRNDDLVPTSQPMESNSSVFGPDSPICRALVGSLQNSQATRILWRQIQPFVEGKILYTPNTTLTKRIVERAEQVFSSIKQIVYLADDWKTFSVGLTDFLNNSVAINAVRNIVDGPICGWLTFIINNQGLNGQTSFSLPDNTCAFLKNYLSNGPRNGSYDWRNSIEEVTEILNTVKMYGQCFEFNKFEGKETEDILEKDALDLIDKNRFWAGVVFTNIDKTTTELPTHVEYKIRMDTDKTDSTKKVQDKYYRPGPRDRFLPDLKYFTYGFVYIQDMVEHAIIELQTGIEGLQNGVGVITQQFPYSCWTRDRFIYAISRSLPLFMILAWVLTTAMLCKSIVYEKERRLKEAMKIMGLSNLVHWVAWFINAFVVMFCTILILAVLFKAGKVLEASDPSIVIVFLMIFATSTIVQCFLISTFFNRPNLAACCTGFIYFCLYLPYTLLIQWDDYMTLDYKLLACLSSSVAFGYGCNFIALYEEQNIGLQWNNVADTPIIDDDFTMAHCFLMMIVDTIIYAILTWYIESVFPGQFGMPKKWYFFVTKSYWCGHTVRSDGNLRSTGTLELEGPEGSNHSFESEPKNRKLGVAIRNLKKVYSSGKKVAVDNLTLNFYEGQITSFLGHNGAGKTTTMSILTGLFPPTDGTAYVYGEDILTSMDEIRSSLGMCPQHNVLFDMLTVEEHMWFFARLKGAGQEATKKETEKMIKDIGLPHKRHELTTSLSGGMKRKLSVAIAFAGGSRTVILDEPTAGVDPYARRAIWELLLKFKKDRTIILSTHHMDEADILGDRIAIISQGKLCCCGSSLFLKNRYGSGYYLTLVRSDDVDEDELLRRELEMVSSRPQSAASIRTLVDVKPALNEDDEGYVENKSDNSDSNPPSDPPTPPSESTKMVPGFTVKRISAFIQKYVSGSHLVEDNTTELCYQLPTEAAHRGDFEQLFRALEKCHKELGISSYGISDTSLEEVFLKVAEETGVDEADDEVKRSKLEEITGSGALPRPVTRLSFRRKKKLSLFGRKRYARVDSKTDLMDDTDAESVISEATTEVGDLGFTHGEQERVTGWRYLLRQFVALIIKRWHHVRRSKKGFVCEIILPAFFVLLAMIFTLITPPFEEQPPLELHPWHYEPKKGDDHLYMFYSNDRTSSKVTQSMETMVQSREGVGNRCMDPSIKTIKGHPCEPVGPQQMPVSSTQFSSPNCSCDTGWQICPADAGGPEPDKILLDTTDYLYNMSSRDISDWLVKTLKKYRRRRYGGLTFGDVDIDASVNSTQVRAAINRIIRALNNGTDLPVPDLAFLEDIEDIIPTLITRNVGKVWFNNKGWVASVAFMNVMNNLILRSNLPAGKAPAKYGITAINHPIKYTKAQLNDQLLYSSAVDVVIAICVIFAMSFIPASFVMFLIEERASNSKHLQFVSGVKPIIYWVASFCWDMVNYLIPAVLCIFIFLAFNKQAYVSATNGPCLVALLFLYGWAMIPLMYPWSRVFSVPSTALVTLKSVNIFLGTTATLATFIIEFLEEDDEELRNINKILKAVFLLLPQYCLGRGLIDMSRNQLYTDVYAALGEDVFVNPFKFDQVGRNLLSMFCLGVFFFILNILIEYNFFIRFKSKPAKGGSVANEDEDVAKERKRVMSGGADGDVLKLENLTKVYTMRGKKGRSTAVDRLCVGVPKGQCFGLLGVNGAGKTTTFKMLTGDVSVTRGNAFLKQISILKDMVSVRQHLGYCPQFDALDPLLTPVEHLRFYARLRGIPERNVKQVAYWAVRKLGLLRYADKVAGDLSGGNKRKLSTAIALIGNPPVIFLDEPTTGMDPKARRFLWDCINNIVKDGRSVILTSHSMEECEALCGRLAIMVNGQFKCIGSTQHLKNRFGDGYTLILRVSGEKPNMRPVEDFISQTFPASILREKHHNMLQYQLRSNISLANMFGKMQAARERLGVEDYSISQTTLDQVFINFAKQQTDLLDDEIELPPDLAAYEKITVEAGELEYEEQSLSGSTVGLIRNSMLNLKDDDLSRPQSALSQPDNFMIQSDLALGRPDSARSRPDSARSRPDSARSRPDSARSRPDSVMSRPESVLSTGETSVRSMPVQSFTDKETAAPIISLPIQEDDAGDDEIIDVVYSTSDRDRSGRRPVANLNDFPMPDAENFASSTHL